MNQNVYSPSLYSCQKVAMGSLSKELEVIENAHPSGIANRLFYFAIPPNVFLDTAATIKSTAVRYIQEEKRVKGYVRVIYLKQVAQ